MTIQELNFRRKAKTLSKRVKTKELFGYTDTDKDTVTCYLNPKSKLYKLLAKHYCLSGDCFILIEHWKDESSTHCCVMWENDYLNIDDIITKKFNHTILSYINQAA